MNTLVTNERGGVQSRIRGRYDLLSPIAMKELAIVLEEGATKYGDYNWHNIPVVDHINHALAHIFEYQRTCELEELTHAFCRLMFAVHMHIEETPNETD